jgi:hypothetical protein
VADQDREKTCSMRDKNRHALGQETLTDPDHFPGHEIPDQTG